MEEKFQFGFVKTVIVKDFECENNILLPGTCLSFSLQAY